MELKRISLFCKTLATVSAPCQIVKISSLNEFQYFVNMNENILPKIFQTLSAFSVPCQIVKIRAFIRASSFVNLYENILTKILALIF